MREGRRITVTRSRRLVIVEKGIKESRKFCVQWTARQEGEEVAKTRIAAIMKTAVKACKMSIAPHRERMRTHTCNLVATNAIQTYEHNTCLTKCLAPQFLNAECITITKQ